LQLEVNHHRLQMKLGEFVTQLENGEPCMLCGSTHHPKTLQVDDVQIILNQALKEIEGIQENDKELGSIDNALLKLIQQEQHLHVQIEDTNHYLAREQNNSRLHENAFSWPEFSSTDPTLIEKAFHNAKESQLKLKELEENIEKTERHILKTQ